MLRHFAIAALLVVQLSGQTYRVRTQAMPTRSAVPSNGLLAEYRLDAGIYQNVVLFSEDLTNGAWAKGANTTVTQQSTTGPTGATVTASQIAWTGLNVGVSQSWNCSGACGAGTSWTFGFWAKGAVGGESVLISFNGNGITDGNTPSNTITLNSNWTFYTYPWTLIASNVTSLQMRITSGATGATKTGYFYQLHLNAGTSPLPYRIRPFPTRWIDYSGNGNDAVTAGPNGFNTYNSTGYPTATQDHSLYLPTSISNLVRTIVVVMTTGGVDQRDVAGPVNGAGIVPQMYTQDQRPAMGNTADVFHFVRTVCGEPLQNGVNMLTFVSNDPVQALDRIFINGHECVYQRQNNSNGTYTFRTTVGTAISTWSVGGTSVSITGAFAGNNYISQTVSYVLAYSVPFDAARVRQTFRELSSRTADDRALALSDINTAHTNTGNFIVFAGNSLTRAYDPSLGTMLQVNTYPYKVAASLSSPVSWVNMAYDGNPTEYIAACEPTQWANLYDTQHAHNVVVLWETTNSLIYGVGSTSGVVCGQGYVGGGTPDTATQAYNSLVSAAQSAHAQGWKTVCLTPLPRSDQGAGNAAFETLRLSARTLILANTADCDVIADVGNPTAVSTCGNGATTSTTIGNVASNSNSTYYQTDQTHGKPALYDIVACFVTASLGTLGVN